MTVLCTLQEIRTQAGFVFTSLLVTNNNSNNNNKGLITAFVIGGSLSVIVPIELESFFFCWEGGGRKTGENPHETASTGI